MVLTPLRRFYQWSVPAETRARVARLRRYLGREEFQRARSVAGFGFALRQQLAALCRWPRTVSVRVGNTRCRIRPGTSDIRTLEQIFVRRQYAADLGFTPATIIDAGANLGASVLYFASRWPGAKIAALEPEPSNFALLGVNVGHLPGVTPLAAALWPDDAAVRVENPGDDKWSFRMARGNAAESEATVPAYSLPTLLAKLGWPRVDLLKIDIEGAERELFADGAPWLAQVGAWVVEIHESFAPGAEAAVRRAAVAHGFRAAQHGESTWFTR